MRLLFERLQLECIPGRMIHFLLVFKRRWIDECGQEIHRSYVL
jgi:hypothetical protein